MRGSQGRDEIGGATVRLGAGEEAQPSPIARVSVTRRSVTPTRDELGAASDPPASGEEAKATPIARGVGYTSSVTPHHVTKSARPATLPRPGRKPEPPILPGVSVTHAAAPPRTSEVAGRALNVRIRPKRPARRLRSLGAGAGARHRRAAARRLPSAPPIPPPRVPVALATRRSPQGSRQRAVRWGAMGRGGARWGGCALAHRFTARPPQTMRPSGHASTCLVARHTCQHYELSTRA